MKPKALLIALIAMTASYMILASPTLQTNSPSTTSNPVAITENSSVPIDTTIAAAPPMVTTNSGSHFPTSTSLTASAEPRDYKSELNGSLSTYTEPRNDIPSVSKEVVVVSNPEFYSYTLSTVTILLSVLTLVVGAFTGVGLSIAIKVHKDRVQLDKTRLSFDEHQKQIKEDLWKKHEEMLAIMRRTAFGMEKLVKAKRELANLLVKTTPDSKRVYASIQKTVGFPDLECLRLYAIALEKCEGDIDIIRLIRNGLAEYNRNPELSTARQIAVTNST